MSDDRSPLKGRPLRQAGQSCEERRRRLFDDKLKLPLYFAATALVLAIVEFLRDYWPMRGPWTYLGLAIAASIFAGFRVSKYVSEMRNLKQQTGSVL